MFSRSGTQLVMVLHEFSFLQAYPEFLITYTIVKPEEAIAKPLKS